MPIVPGGGDRWAGRRALEAVIVEVVKLSQVKLSQVKRGN